MPTLKIQLDGETHRRFKVACARAAVGCPGIFVPKFEPVRWKVNRLHVNFGDVNYNEYLIPYDYEAPQNFYGEWTFIVGPKTDPLVVWDSVVMPGDDRVIDCVFHVREPHPSFLQKISPSVG